MVAFLFSDSSRIFWSNFLASSIKILKECSLGSWLTIDLPFTRNDQPHPAIAGHNNNSVLSCIVQMVMLGYKNELTRSSASIAKKLQQVRLYSTRLKK